MNKKLPAVMVMLALYSVCLQARADEFGAMESEVARFAKSAQGLMPMARLVSADMSKPLVLSSSVRKMTLTEQEKLKFYELAEYAKTQADTAIRSGWLLAMHKFKLSGSYNDNGSFSVDHFYVGEAHSFDEVNAFSINTDGSVSSDSLIPDRRHSAEEKRAVLIKEIAYWMAYKIPGK